MSQPQAEYITKEEVEEGLSLLRGEPAAIISRPHSVLAVGDNGLVDYKVWGWVKMSARFRSHLKKLKGARGIIWLCLALSIDENGEFKATVKEIVELTDYSHTEVLNSIAELEKMGYLSVNRGGKKNVYIPNFVARGINEPKESQVSLVKKVESTPVDQVESTPPIDKTPSSIKELKELMPLSIENAIAAGLPVTGAIIANSNGSHFEGREIFLPDHLPLVDWYHERTGQVCRKKDRNSWMKAVREWVDAGLTPDDLQAAYEVDIIWRKVIANPNELTSKAIALKAQKNSKPPETMRPEYQRYVPPEQTDELISNPKAKK